MGRGIEWLKERMTAMQITGRTKVGRKRVGSLCDAFLFLFREYTECFFLSFLFCDTEPARKKAEQEYVARYPSQLLSERCFRGSWDRKKLTRVHSYRLPGHL